MGAGEGPSAGAVCANCCGICCGAVAFIVFIVPGVVLILLQRLVLEYEDGFTWLLILGGVLAGIGAFILLGALISCCRACCCSGSEKSSEVAPQAAWEKAQKQMQQEFGKAGKPREEFYALPQQLMQTIQTAVDSYREKSKAANGTHPLVMVTPSQPCTDIRVDEV